MLTSFPLFSFKAKQSKVESELNLNGDAIICEKTKEQMSLGGCLCIKYFTALRLSCTSKCTYYITSTGI